MFQQRTSHTAPTGVLFADTPNSACLMALIRSILFPISRPSTIQPNWSTLLHPKRLTREVGGCRVAGLDPCAGGHSDIFAAANIMTLHLQLPSFSSRDHLGPSL